MQAENAKQLLRGMDMRSMSLRDFYKHKESEGEESDDSQNRSFGELSADDEAEEDVK